MQAQPKVTLFSNKNLTRKLIIAGTIYIQTYHIVDGQETPVSLIPAPKKG